MGHKAVEETIKRHFPFWSKTGLEIVGSNPQDGTIWPKEITSIAFGCNAHAGSLATPRLINILDYLSLRTDVDQVCLIEYDLVILKPIHLPDGICFGSMIAPDENVDGQSRFKHDEYYPPPWFFLQTIAGDMADQARKLYAADDYEGGYHDRFFARILSTMGLKSTLLPETCHGYFEADPVRKEQARKQVQALKATYLHCVKTQEDLNYFLCK